MENKIRIGVYVCWCGTNISKMVDVEDVAKEIEKLPDVAISRDYKYMCSDPGQELIIKDIKAYKLDRIVVAACSPRMHEKTFRKALSKAGLNPYMFQMANIREQVSWVHIDKEAATQKAKALVVAAVKRIKWHESLEKKTVNINPATLILGGGVAGMSAALTIAEAGKKVYLIEKTQELGGRLRQLDLMYPLMENAQQLIRPLIELVRDHELIDIFFNSTLSAVNGYIGNFETQIIQGKKVYELKFGNIIIATGLKSFDPTSIKEYGYGKNPDVITSMEFEEILQKGSIQTKDGKEPKNIALIHCVGSRNKNQHEYCSRTCCMVALKFANQIKSALEDVNVFDIYADMRAFGNGCEELYTETSRKGIMFLMFDQNSELPQIRKANPKDDCNYLISVNEKLSGESIDVPADMVVLMVAVEAHEDVKNTAHAVGISIGANKFFIEKHPKLDPVATTTEGVYIVGNCQSPKNITESIDQAQAASARILATINYGSVEVEVITSVVNEEICCGCQTCISVCPYTAISFDEEKNVSVVNEVLCKGCGTCGSTCPTGAIRSKHFTDRQILSQIKGLVEKSNELKEV